RADFAHRRACRHKELIIAQLFNFSGYGSLSGSHRALAEAVRENRVQFSFLERLGQVILSTQLDGLGHFARVCYAGKHHDWNSRVSLAQAFERLETVQFRHQQVEKDKVWLVAIL